MSIVRADQIELDRDALARVAERFGVRSLEPLGGFENLLFRSTDPLGVVVRITHSNRRTLEQITGEFEFVEHLASRGAAVVRPVHSVDGKLVEEWTIDDGKLFIVAMTEAPGALKSPEKWTPSDNENYGRALGQLHAAARDFEPSDPSRRRPPWFGPQGEPGFGADPLRSRFDRLVERARALPAGGAELLIHQDAHHGNLHIAADGSMTLFDFDDCAYGSATHDLAICFFYRFYGAEELDLARTRAFTEPFLSGYTSVTPLPDDWPRGVDEFLSLREVELLFLTRALPKKRPIHLRFIEQAERNVREDAPYVGVPASEWLSPPS